MRNRKFTTGEMATLCNLNKKTLFYYDQIDLLKPAIVEANGYRYYTNDQIDLLGKIKALQSVGFTLLEIKQQLSADNIPKGIETLYHQKRKIREKIHELVTVEENLNQKVLELEHYQETGNHQVFVKECEEEWLYVDSASRQEGIVTNFLLDGYHYGLILHDAAAKDMNKYQIVHHYEEANFTKERGTYAGVYFRTEEKQILTNAIEALEILENSDHRLTGPVYLKDIATDFALFQDGDLPFQITRKVEPRD